MQKTYWWRACLTAACFIYILVAFVSVCDMKLGRCVGGNSILITRTLFHFSLSLLIVSPFLFFVSDFVFLKWLRFAIIWFIVTAIFVIMAPVYTGGFMGFGATKELVSIWMGSLFVIISLIKIACNAHAISSLKSFFSKS